MRSLVISLLLLSTLGAQAQYRPDILGPDFEQLTITQPNDYDGQVVTTLVRRTPLEGVSRAVLYVHGYNDYFFQEEMASRFADSLYQFYAVDLRKYGRSMFEGQTPFKVYDLKEYYADIDAAIDVIISEGIDDITLVGHSTGGLITSLYCHDMGDSLRVNRLILNSPFFDMNMSWFVETFAEPVISLLGSIFKDWVVSPASDKVGGYARSIHSNYDGEWWFDPSLKFLTSQANTAGWLRAIHRGHTRIKRGLEIPCPVLVLYSDKSAWGEWGDLYFVSDSVLDIEDIDKYSDSIGADVTEVVIEDGLHDLALSRPDVRNRYFTEIFEWLE